MDIPPYMQPGSNGPGVVPLISFLTGWVGSEMGHTHGLSPDTDFTPGGRCEEWVKRYQNKYGLTVDGGVGPEMRRTMKKMHGFDLELAIQSVGGRTTFIQLDGSEIVWEPNT